jgi:hypothetical protein
MKCLRVRGHFSRRTLNTTDPNAPPLQPCAQFIDICLSEREEVVCYQKEGDDTTEDSGRDFTPEAFRIYI